jgi:citrate lyase subunit beta/citryl-CoA lyase
LIHPKQIAAANAAFAPLPAEVDHARRVIEAHRQARAQGQGVALLDGKLVEALHVAEAERLLAQAEAIAALEAANAPPA